MGQLCALPQALDPLSPPPPNISRLGDVWDHRTRFNVRRHHGHGLVDAASGAAEVAGAVCAVAAALLRGEPPIVPGTVQAPAAAARAGRPSPPSPP